MLVLVVVLILLRLQLRLPSVTPTLGTCSHFAFLLLVITIAFVGIVAGIPAIPLVVLLLAGGDAKARRWGADGAHHRRPHAPRYGTAAAHGVREIRAAERSGAGAIFLSPLHPTRSHPGAPTLGRMRFAALARTTRLPVIALGGIDRIRGRMAMRVGAWGWAAIDAWS